MSRYRLYTRNSVANTTLFSIHIKTNAYLQGFGMSTMGKILLDVTKKMGKITRKNKMHLTIIYNYGMINHTNHTAGEITMNIPEGKFAWMVKIGEKGQFVIPKEARELFDLQPGDEILVLGDKERGIAILPKAKQQDFVKQIFSDIEE